MAKKVNFNDGGHVDFTDFRDDQKFVRRDLMRYIANSWLVDDNYTVQSCNPLKVRPDVTSGTLTMGITHWAFPVTPSDTDDRTAVIAELPAINQSVSAVSATNFRQDIIAVKLDENVNGSLTATDFEDAVTRAKSSQNLVRLISDNISFEVVEGTEQTTEALAFANPPTPTAGFTAVAGYILDDAENSIDTLVLVPPTGQRQTVRIPLVESANMSNEPASTNFAYSSPMTWTSNAGNPVGFLDIVMDVPRYMFIESMTIHHRFQDDDTNGEYELKSFLRKTTSTTTTFLDFKSSLTLPVGGVGQADSVNFSTAGVAPIWSNGDQKMHHPASVLDQHSLVLDIRDQPAAGNASLLFSVFFTGVVWNEGGNE